MKKRVLAIILAVACIGSMFIGAIAASNSQSVQALLSFDTTIKFNGVTQEFKDAAGSRVYPLMYEGTTYLPVRAVCGLAGIAVDWDGATRTVILGEKDKVKVNESIFKFGNSIWTQGKVTSDMSELVIDGQGYDFGIVAYSETGVGSSQCWDIGEFNTQQKYSKLEAKALATESANMTLVFRKDNEDGTVLKEVKLGGGVAKDFEVNVAGADKVWLGFYAEDKGSLKKDVIITNMYLK